MNTKDLVLFIDAGHGNLNANGTYTTEPIHGKKWKLANTGYHGGGWFYEGYSNKQFAADFIKLATEAGYTCYPVYHPIADNSLTSRTNMANYMKGQLGNPKSLFISFHSNAFDENSRGFQVYHHISSSKGKQVADLIAGHCVPYCSLYGTYSVNPVRPEKFHVLTYTEMPAVLLEILFFDNIMDADLLMDKGFRAGLLECLLEAINEVRL